MSTLPTGTVTLLFTDIAGSTRLWQDFPDLMPASLARHDMLLRSAIESHHGYVVKTVGDAFMAVFPTAQDGVQAALTAQLALCVEPWSAQTPMRVRMGLHTGVCEERDRDYYGHEVNRAARIQGVVHPQQIVLSQATYALCVGSLPTGATFQDLGSHQLKDLREPEPLWQLCHPDLPALFPPLTSLSSLPNNLPLQVTPFVGREQEMGEVKALLSHTRCLTLLGIGGTGKTRLALQVAADLLPGFPHGVWFVDLASLTDARLVPQTVATTLGLRETPDRAISQTLIDYFKPRSLLLLLDNCEHVLDACARLADTLLKACPGLKILATSRERLGISAEQPWRVPSLSLSETGGDAVTLFVERARIQRPDFALAPENSAQIAQLCRQLDGIPLALELAAARLRVLSVEQISQRLQDRFKLLTGGDRTGLPHHQTLRATLDWSYDLLGETEQVLLSRLSVFTGGWTLDAAEQVCRGAEIEEWEVLDLLTALVDKSLVVAEERGDSVRYRLLETVRQYAAEKLIDAGTYRRQHRDYFLMLAEEARAKSIGPQAVATFDMLETEQDNLRAALDFCAADEQSEVQGLQLTVALLRFWLTRGYLAEGREFSRVALAHPNAQSRTKQRADALNTAGGLTYHQGDHMTARTLYEESLAIYRKLGDRQGIGSALNNLGLMAWKRGDYAAGRTLYEESLAIKRESGDKLSIAGTLSNLGLIAQSQGDYSVARTLYEESLAISRELEDRQSIGLALNNLGLLVWSQGEVTTAHTLFEQSLPLFRELGDKPNIANLLGNLGKIASNQGDYATARGLQEESLEIHRELGNRSGIANSFNDLAIVIMNQGDFDTARTLLEDSLALQRELEDKQGIASALNNLGSLAEMQGDFASARAWFTASLTMKQELQNKPGIASALKAFAAVAAKEGLLERAVQLFAASDARHEEIGKGLGPTERQEMEEELAGLSEQLGPSAFEAAWKAGHALSLEQAIEIALGSKEASVTIEAPH